MLPRISITGNIGSGKTTVSRLFEQLGIPVYYSDLRAKQLMMEDADLRRSISSEFGEAVYDEHGQLNRQLLAAQVFGDPERLAALNALVHPAVAKDSLEWHQAFDPLQNLEGLSTKLREISDDVAKAPYTLHESAIAFEIGITDHFDATIVVTAPEQLRLERVMARDGTTEEQIRARMAQQWSEEDKIAKADFLIHNYDNRLLFPQVLAIHRQITQT